MCQFDNFLEVTILPPYVPSEEEKASPALYAKNVQKLYSKTINMPIVDQASYSLLLSIVLRFSPPLSRIFWSGR